MKIKSSYLKYWDVNNLYDWAIPQKLSLGGFKWFQETFQFNEDFIKSYNEDSEEYFLEVDVPYPENLYNLHNDLRLLPETKKTEKVKKLVANLHEKEKMCYTHKKFKTSIKS